MIFRGVSTKFLDTKLSSQVSLPFSFSRDFAERNMGKLVSSTPMASILSWNHFRMTFQIYMLAGRMTKKPEILETLSESN